MTNAIAERIEIVRSVLAKFDPMLAQYTIISLRQRRAAAAQWLG